MACGRGSRHAELVLRRQHCPGEAGVAPLVRPGEARGDVCFDGPIATFEQQLRAALDSHRGDRRFGFGGLGEADKRHARLRNAGFLPRDRADVGPEKMLMVEAEAGDAGHRRMLNDVGRVEAAAEAHFEKTGVGRRTREGEQSDGGRNLEEARLDPVAGVEASVSSAVSASSISRPAIQIRSLNRTR